MAKKKNKQLITTLVIIAVIVGILAYFSVNQTTIEINGVPHPLDKGSLDLGQIQGNYETPYLGSIQTTSGIVINGNNDVGDITLSNGYDDSGENLIMSSSVSGKNGAVNYIQSTFTLPKGTLDINCKTTASGDDYASESHCGVNGKFDIYTISARNPNAVGVQWQNKNENRQIVLSSPTTLTFYAKSQSSASGNSNTIIDIYFSPDTSGGSGGNNTGGGTGGGTGGNNTGGGTGGGSGGGAGGGSGSGNPPVDDYPYGLVFGGLIAFLGATGFAIYKLTRKRR